MRIAISAVHRAALRASVPLRSFIASPLARAVVALPDSIPISTSTSTRVFSSTHSAWKKDKGGKAAKEDKGGKASKKSGGKGGKGGKKGKEEDEDVADTRLSPEEIDAIISKAGQRMEKSLEWAKTTVFDGVERGRGRVTPAILDGVKVAIPDQGLVPLKSVASITVKNNVLTVEVWDNSMIKHVESGIHKANLPGISPQREDVTLRIPVARPTGDVRKAILKSLHDTLEAAKNQVRIARTDALKALGGRGEDGTDDVQKATDQVTLELDKLQQTAKKELEK